MINYIRSLKWTDILTAVFIEHGKIYILLSEMKRELPPATFLFPILAALFDIVAFSFLSVQTGFFFYKITYGLIALSLLYILAIFIFAAVIDLYFQFAGSRGMIKRTIASINVCLVPRLLLLPLVIIFKVTNVAPLAFYAGFSMVLAIWSAIALIRILADMHETTFARSAGAIIIPGIAFSTIGVVAGVSGFVILVEWIAYL